MRKKDDVMNNFALLIDKCKKHLNKINNIYIHIYNISTLSVYKFANKESIV